MSYLQRLNTRNSGTTGLELYNTKRVSCSLLITIFSFNYLHWILPSSGSTYLSQNAIQGPTRPIRQRQPEHAETVTDDRLGQASSVALRSGVGLLVIWSSKGDR
jgi:hypothetical protein